MLRSYLPKGHALKSLELGSEPTPAAYVANMVKVFSLVRDVMAEHGTCWLNIGDSYASGKIDAAPRSSYGLAPKQATNPHADNIRNGVVDGIESGSLCLIPQRLAIALADDGWIVRSVIVWHKPAPMPSSVSGWAWRRCRVKIGPQKVQPAGKFKADAYAKPQGATINGPNGQVFDSKAQWSDCPGCDKCTPHGGYRLRRGSWRPTSSWEPVLMLAKSAGYFADGEPVRQPSAAATVSRNEYTRVLDDPDEQFAVKHDHETTADGANLRDVWTIAAEPLKAAHYAAFPTELVHRCLAAGTSAKGYCPACGAPWVRVVDAGAFIPQADVSAERNGYRGRGESAGPGDVAQGNWVGFPRGHYENNTLGWRPSCSCPPHEPRPGLVLDPFAGSGRTGIEALRMGLDFVGVDLNPEYVAMSRKLLRAESPLFAEVTP